MKTCPFCGAAVEDASQFCTNCGQRLPQTPQRPAAPVANAQFQTRAPYPNQAQPAVQQPFMQPVRQQVTPDQLPPQYRPLSPWAYWGLSLLYAVPIVGFVFMIVFSFNRSNINRRNFTRSYFITLFMVLTVLLILMLCIPRFYYDFWRWTY